MIALYWDIDGTLLTTARAGVFALEAALTEVTGVEADLHASVIASGLTEHQVAAAVFDAAGVDTDPELTDRFLRSYERHLPGALPRREGRVLPGVREILEDLAPRDGVRSFLLTGNTPAGAQAKLAHYGLDGFFDDGAFCVGPGPRSDIARSAVELAPDASERYVIGDTPHDIEAAHAVGARAIAIATGTYSREELAAHDPWLVLDELPAPEEFRRVIGLDPARHRFYFSLLHSGYLRHYSGAIRILCGGGHSVHVAVVREEKHPGDDDLLRELAESCETFTFSVAPGRRAHDPVARVAWWTRALLDVVRYAHPDYAEAPALRARSIAKLGLGRIGSPLLRRPLARLNAPAPAEKVRRRLAFLQRIEDAIPPSRAITASLREFAPDVVLASPVVEYGASQVEYLKSGRALGARTGVCIASWDNLTNKGLVRFQPDRLFVWNEIQRAEAERYHGIPAEKVVATGAARFDAWFERTTSTTPDEFAERVGLEPGPYLLYLCSSAFVAPDEVAFVRRWLGALRASGDAGLRRMGVLVRPYPHNAAPWSGVDLSSFGNAAVYPHVGTHPDRGDPAAVFYDSIAHSTAVVGVNTSALIEAAIEGKAAYTILDPQFARTQQGTLHFHYLRIERGGFVHEAVTLDEHLQQLAAGLADPRAEQARIAGFLGSFIRPCGIDRPAAEVMAEAFLDLAEARVDATTDDREAG